MHNIKLVFGMGNPEDEYSNTRHNIGIYLLKKVLEKLQLTPDYNKKLKCSISKYQKEQIIFILSNSYVNQSGYCLSQVMNYYKIKTDEILIVHDDMNLDFPRISLKYNGSPHGHNGIKDIINNLNTKKFYKLRIGIGKPQRKEYNSKHVLGRLGQDEKKIIDNRIKVITDKIDRSNFLDIINDLK
jgi:PTH1 family peptidyl-tRNA hydrolase